MAAKPVMLVLLAFAGLHTACTSGAQPASSAAAFDRIVLPTGQAPGSILIADINHDGYPDLLIANTGGETLTVLLGDGHGHFHAAAGDPPRTGHSPNDLAIGDFNGDGHPDLLIANTETPNLTILLGDGKGGFQPAAHSPFVTTSQPHVHGVAVGDFNGDGKLDAVTDSWAHDHILMFFGDGAGNLITPGRIFNTGKRPYQRLRTADFNRDGKMDVVTTDLDANAVSILLGDGHGGLTDAPGSPVPAGGAPWAVTIDDFNRDGNPDLAVVPYDRDLKDAKDLGVTVLLGDGRGGFRKLRADPLSLAGCRGPDRIATGDINGDGFPDIAVTCAQNNRLMLFFGSKDGAFRAVSQEVQTGWSGLAVGDLNGDGKADIAVSNAGEGPRSTPAGTVTVFLRMR